jgi:hypothetical protein
MSQNPELSTLASRRQALDSGPIPEGPRRRPNGSISCHQLIEDGIALKEEGRGSVVVCLGPRRVIGAMLLLHVINVVEADSRCSGDRTTTWMAECKVSALSRFQRALAQREVRTVPGIAAAAARQVKPPQAPAECIPVVVPIPA